MVLLLADKSSEDPDDGPSIRDLVPRDDRGAREFDFLIDVDSVVDYLDEIIAQPAVGEVAALDRVRVREDPARECPVGQAISPVALEDGKAVPGDDGRSAAEGGKSSEPDVLVEVRDHDVDLPLQIDPAQAENVPETEVAADPKRSDREVPLPASREKERALPSAEGDPVPAPPQSVRGGHHPHLAAPPNEGSDAVHEEDVHRETARRPAYSVPSSCSS